MAEPGLASTETVACGRRDARERFEAFWACEMIERPCLQVYVDSTRPGPRIADPVRYWTDPETFFSTNRHRYRNRRYLGEAFPVLYPLYGGIGAILGAELEYSANTIWIRPVFEDLDQIDLTMVSVDHPVMRGMSELLRYCAEHGAGECRVAFPQMGNAGDALAALRGYEGYCLDIHDRMDDVMALEARLTEVWKMLYDHFHGILEDCNSGSTGWLPAWHPRRMALIEFDLGGLISPAAFAAFLPWLIERARHADRAIYHLDGESALVHLDTILACPDFDAVQWEPGAGSAPMPSWLPVLKKIQKARKALYVGYSGLQPSQALHLLRELRPEGLILPVRVSSEEEGVRFIEHVRGLY